MNSIYVNWGGGRIRITPMPGVPVPSIELVTSVHGFCFDQGKLLLVDLNHRGGDIPGGHRESGETPEQAFRREALEEAYVEGRCTYLGCSEIDHRENPRWQPGGKYPLVGYQVYFRMDIDRLLPFDGAYESRGRRLVDPSDAPRHHHSWNEQLAFWLAEALAAEGR